MFLLSLVRRGGGIVTLLLRGEEGAVPGCHGDKVRAFPRYHHKFMRRSRLLVATATQRDCSRRPPRPPPPPPSLRQGGGWGCPSLAARLPWRRRVPGPAPLGLTALAASRLRSALFPRSPCALKPETAAASARTLRPGAAGRSRSRSRSAPAACRPPRRLHRSSLAHCESRPRRPTPWG